MIKGYITLKQASELSGKTVEALKKQCQEGRIRGAIKQGKTWFVPQGEIIVTDEPTIANGSLSYLITLVEAGGKGTSYTVTFMVGGTVISGNLISRSEYIDYTESSLLGSLKFSGSADTDEIKDKFSEFTQKYFDNMRSYKEEGIPTFVHIKDVTVLQHGSPHSIASIVMRLRTSSIDGFAIGRLDRAEP